jgi:membrane dipeptidase
VSFSEKESRRRFLWKGAQSVGAAAMLRPLPVWALNTMHSPAAAVVAKTIGIDTHNHIDVPLTDAEVPGPDIDLSGEMKRSGLAAICMTFATDYQPGNAYDRFLKGLASMDVQLRRNGIKRSLSAADIRTAHRRGQPTVVQSVEGAHFLEGQFGRLEEAYDRGLRHLGLLHDSDATVPLGDVYTNPPRFHGLTDFGAAVIRECNRLGILVDLAHANMPTTEAALKVATHPVVVSHTGLDTELGSDPRMAEMMRPRLISKVQAKVVADAGGVIGVWTHLSDSPLEFAHNLRAMVDVIGVDHVCLGTDTKLTKPSPRPMGPRPGNGQPAGVAHPGGSSSDAHSKQEHPEVGQRTNMAWADQTAGFYYAVVDAMLKTGFHADEIGKIGGGNYLRLLSEAVGG